MSPGPPGTGPDERLVRLLGDPDLSWLVERVRRRLQQGHELSGTAVLSDPSPEQRTAARRLLGTRPRPGAGLTVSLEAVDEVLRRSGAAPDGLRAAVELLIGPVGATAELAERERREWDTARAPVDHVIAAHPASPVLAVWWQAVRAQGLVHRLGPVEQATASLADLARVLAALPAGGEPLGSFSARVLGHAHDLDEGRPLTSLVLGAARVIGGLAEPDPAEGRTARWRREVWAGVGLLRDDLSSTVLTLGLPGDDRTVTGQVLRLMQPAGQPAVLTLRQLVLDPPDLRNSGGRRVRICENPVLLSVAAQQLGARCPPLICTGGQPGVAVMQLLRGLGEAGAELSFHGDFDWGGLRIANVLFRRLPLRPWRFDTAAYRAAAAGAAGRVLAGPAVVADWDADLGRVMEQTGTAVEEEHVLPDLLADLAEPEINGQPIQGSDPPAGSKP